MYGKIICFTGVDGTGKTTLAKRLAAALSESGRPYTYVYGRYRPYLVRPVWAFIKRFFFPPINPTQDWKGYEIRKRTQLQKPLARFLHVSLILIDYFIQLVPRITIPFLIGSRFVCDRYVQDTVISDLAPALQYSDKQIQSAIRRFFLFLPKPTLLFVLDACEEVSLARKTDIPAREYLSERRRMFHLLGGEPGTVLLDGGGPLEENWIVVKKAVHDMLGEAL